MNKKILVTYASRSGSTAEIAEAISKTLDRNEVQVDLLPLQEVKNISSYSAIVIGSPIRQSRWLPEAMDFIRTHRSELTKKPLAIFTVCITLAMANGDQSRHAVREWIAPVRAQVNPVSEGLFARMLDFTRMPLTLDTLKFRLTAALGIFPKADRRDWNAIRTWAESLSPLLLQ